MHPIERLRMVARAAGEGPALVAREAAGALAAFADDPAGLVTACRRLVDRQPTSAPVWWLAARVLAAGEPAREAWRSADLLDEDATPEALAAALPDDGTVTLVGWAEQSTEALRRHGGLAVRLLDDGDCWDVARRLERAGIDVATVPESGVAAAVASSDLVLVEASAVGPDGFVAAAGAHAAAAVARHEGVETWLVAGVGRVLPARLWAALRDRVLARAEPWLDHDEMVPLDLVDLLVGPAGAQAPADAVAGRRGDCPVVPELLRGVSST